MQKQMIAVIGAMAIALAASPAQAAPGDMSVATFLTKAEGLKAKGMAAMFSSDLNVLKAEMQGAMARYKVQSEAQRKAGKPHSCPPPKARFNSNDLLAFLNGYPAPARASTTMTTAVGDLMKSRFPCK